jgi:phospholipase A1
MPPATPTRPAALLLGLAFAASAVATETTDGKELLPALERCAAIGAEADRLACYDKAMGRAPAAAVAPASGAGPDGKPAESPSTTLLAPSGGALPDADRPADETPPSFLANYWELEPQTKRGRFNFLGYRVNYVLPAHVTSRINRAPQSPTQAVVELPDYKREEAKFQLSLRTKIAQDLLIEQADLWVAFTQQATWQIWNGKDSKPFRNSDYEPEISYVVPTGERLRRLPLGVQWRYTQLALVHQSNGQSDPLSRSWNRVSLAAGFEHGDWSLISRWNHRLGEDPSTDNNPDLLNYRGRGEFQLNWTAGKQASALTYRTSLRDTRYGALQFEWSYPVFRDQPNGLRWYVQAFRGYGETLTDYNFRQTSIGAGLAFLQF